jgi:hypothetical protein
MSAHGGNFACHSGTSAEAGRAVCDALAHELASWIAKEFVDVRLSLAAET